GFHCTTVVEPVLRAGFVVRFYRVCQDLTVDLDDVARQLSGEVKAVLVIHFFGFQTPLEPFLALRKSYGFYIIEDWAHSFLAGPEPHLPGLQGDFSVFSFYKHTACFAGGGLRGNANVDWLTMPTRGAGLRQNVIILKHLLEQVVDNSPDGILKNSLQKLETWRVERKRSRKDDSARALY